MLLNKNLNEERKAQTKQGKIGKMRRLVQGHTRKMSLGLKKAATIRLGRNAAGTGAGQEGEEGKTVEQKKANLAAMQAENGSKLIDIIESCNQHEGRAVKTQQFFDD